MSVLNQSGEEQVECPLCMEPLEVDDLNFYPCTCGYQICRFCWHRIRTDENGLCPACRKAYSENPADFIPLSKEQVAQLKAEKRQRDQQRKAKLTESRKHLASVRVVQRNLVFVVGLPMRLADPEVLKRHEYFGKFGKIHKVVINQSTAYAGTQGPSASAYVTYLKSDDALRAIQSVNNSTLDGKTIKTSLGTTKYCSHFMKNQPCPKPDCMYLHDFGDQEASFTKEQMHAGKHQEYEKKLHDSLLTKQAMALQQQAAAAQATAAAAAAAAAAAQVGDVKTSGKAKHGATDSRDNKEREATGVGSANGKDNSGGNWWPHADQDKGDTNTSGSGKSCKDGASNGRHDAKPEKSKRNKKNTSAGVSESNCKNGKCRSEETASAPTSREKEKDKEGRELEKKQPPTQSAPLEKEKERENEKRDRKDSTRTSSSNSNDAKRPASAAVVEIINNNTIDAGDVDVERTPEPETTLNGDVEVDTLEGAGDMVHQPRAHLRHVRQNGVAVEELKIAAHDDNSSFFTSSSFACAKLSAENKGDGDESASLLDRQISGHLLDINDGDAWDFDFGYTNHSHHLEELAAQRHRQQEAPKDPLEPFANGFGALDTFNKLDAFMDTPYIAANTESLLEALAKNSVNYQMHPAHQQQQQQPQQQQLGHSHYMNGHKDALLPGLSGMGSLSLLEQHQQQQVQQQNFPKILDMYRRNMCAPLQQLPQQQQQPQAHQMMNGLHSQSNGFHNHTSFAQQQQHHFNNHINLVDKRMALLQQQRQMEENFVNITLGKQLQQQQQHNMLHPQMNGHFDSFGLGTSFGLGVSTSNMQKQAHQVQTQGSGQGQGQAQMQVRHVVDDKDLDFRFQEAQKALEALVESDSHVHNSGRTTLGSNQVNGLVHSQSGAHLPPPPPGFVQPSTHMNSFGSKILPFLNMNSQQPPQINTTQNNWPSSFSQIQPQQNQHSKGMGGVCNDWKVLDTAIISSRRHIPSLGPLLDHYAPGSQPGANLQQQQQQQAQQAQHHQLAAAAQQQQQQQQRTYDMYATFSNYASPLPPAYGNGYQSHLIGAGAGSQPSGGLNWLGAELAGAQISTPPGFRAAGQATKQQEC